MLSSAKRSRSSRSSTTSVPDRSPEPLFLPGPVQTRAVLGLNYPPRGSWGLVPSLHMAIPENLLYVAPPRPRLWRSSPAPGAGAVSGIPDGNPCPRVALEKTSWRRPKGPGAQIQPDPGPHGSRDARSRQWTRGGSSRWRGPGTGEPLLPAQGEPIKPLPASPTLRGKRDRHSGIRGGGRLLEVIFFEDFLKPIVKRIDGASTKAKNRVNSVLADPLSDLVWMGIHPCLCGILF